MRDFWHEMTSDVGAYMISFVATASVMQTAFHQTVFTAQSLLIVPV